MADWGPPSSGDPWRRRHRRQALLFVVLLLLVLGAGTWAGGVYLGYWQFPGEPSSAGTSTPAVSCPPPLAAQVAPPEIAVNVYNSTDRAGLASTTAGELRARGYLVQQIADDPLVAGVQDTLHVRYGVAGEAAAASVGLLAPGAVLVPDARTSATVDVVLGAAYAGLQAPEVVAASPPLPVPPRPGCEPTPTPPPLPEATPTPTA